MDEHYYYYEEYTIVGHGMGAMVGCHLALLSPDKVKGLICINPLRPDGYKSDIKINNR